MIAAMVEEVLSQIFQAGLDPEVKGQVVEAPWVITLVNRHWRRVATGDSRLWTDILVPDANRHPSKRVEAQLERSKHRLLRISFTDGAQQNPARAASILQQLMSNSVRWKEATFNLEETTSSVISGVRGQIPELRYLDLNISNDAFLEDPGFQACGGAFSIAPMLQELRFGYLVGDPPDVAVNHLTHFRGVWTMDIQERILAH